MFAGASHGGAEISFLLRFVRISCFTHGFTRRNALARHLALTATLHDIIIYRNVFQI